MNKASINYRQEARNLFDRARGVPDIMQCLQKINDPPTLNKVVEELKKYWHRQERACHELTGYSNGDGQWIPTWPTIDEDLNNIIELVSESSDTPCETPTTSYQPTKRTTKKPTTMPIIVHKQEGTITNYENCVFNHYTTVTPQQPDQTPLAEEVVAIDMSLFAEDHVPSYVEQEIKLALRAAKSKAERAKAMYALQERGLINLDQYPSDEERAKQLNLHQDICQFSPDSIQRGRQLWEES
jgi:hypothetical protein